MDQCRRRNHQIGGRYDNALLSQGAPHLAKLVSAARLKIEDLNIGKQLRDSVKQTLRIRYSKRT